MNLFTYIIIYNNIGWGYTNTTPLEMNNIPNTGY